ncbi:MAG: hypothetical protein U0414_07110 [Polyangiaceae bacterium]
MAKNSPKSMEPSAAAALLEKKLDPRGRCTIADAAEQSGLALRDAESGLHALVAKYRGHLSVTEQGELLFSFPHGFSQPWVVKSAFSRFFGAIGRGALGVARFIVRAWIAIVLVGYALVFLAILIGLATSNRDRNRGGSGLGAIGLLLRVVFDAFFWMWHPFSPFYVAPTMGYRRSYRGRDEREETKEPFYQRVDRFFFGPPAPPVDPLENERHIVERIRRSKGRIGVTDVIRATGLPRDEADALMSKLMLDYDGTVDVTEDGAIVYSFPSLRKTVKGPDPLRDRASFTPVQPKQLPPLTGNTAGTNLAIIGLNGFNLVMSIYALANNLTIHRLQLMLSKVPSYKIPLEGTPIALGIVPLVFSIALLAIPVFRAIWRPIKQARLDRVNTELAVRRAAIESAERGGMTEEDMREAVERVIRKPANDKVILDEVARLGGDVDNAPSGKVRYRFPDFEREAKAIEAEREAAAEEEAQVGPVIFSSES